MGKVELIKQLDFQFYLNVYSTFFRGYKIQDTGCKKNFSTMLKPDTLYPESCILYLF